MIMWQRTREGTAHILVGVVVGVGALDKVWPVTVMSEEACA